MKTRTREEQSAKEDALTQTSRGVPPRIEETPEEENETAPPPDTTGRFDWIMLVLWLFVVVSFALMVFAAYLLWAKCRGA